MPTKPVININPHTKIFGVGIKKSDIEIEFYRSSGPGGQHKNKTATAVRIRHIPTGIVVHASERRSQHLNREVATKRLMAALEKRAFKPKKRIPTKVSELQKGKRLKEKKYTARKKALRKSLEEV
ncbi:MAG: peptide chain release factor-like protein [Deltaproteobacteria bacterium]|nr:peptide chain release factor-like protein [Deltaproteobacteria bacterium]